MHFGTVTAQFSNVVVSITSISTTIEWFLIIHSLGLLVLHYIHCCTILLLCPSPTHQPSAPSFHFYFLAVERILHLFFPFILIVSPGWMTSRESNNWGKYSSLGLKWLAYIKCCHRFNWRMALWLLTLAAPVKLFPPCSACVVVLGKGWVHCCSHRGWKDCHQWCNFGTVILLVVVGAS